MENTSFESLTINHLLHQHGFNLEPRKIDMRNFDGYDPITCIFQMDELFYLHQVSTVQKVIIASLYLDHDQFVWYQWFCNRKKDSIVSSFIIFDESIEYYGDINRNNLFIQLINLRQKVTNAKHIN